MKREYQLMDYIITWALDHQIKVTNLQVNQLIFIFDLINRVEHYEPLIKAKFRRTAYGPIDKQLYDEYNHEPNNYIEHIRYHTEGYTIITGKAIVDKFEMPKLHKNIERLVNQYIENLLTYPTFQLAYHLNGAPGQPAVDKRYRKEHYESMEKWFSNPYYRFWQHKYKA